MNELLALLLPSNEVKMSTSIDHHSCLSGDSSAMEQAKGIQVDSSGQFPTFMKQLLKSHLSGKYYLGLPKKFCDAHMPNHDETIVLVDENEQEYNTKYSVRKNRLSGGWRTFCVAHNLLEGDALVFHVIQPCKFRVYIMRAGKLSENDGSAVGDQTCDFANIKPISAVKMEDQMDESAPFPIGKTTLQTYLTSLDFDIHHETKKRRLISDINIKLGTSQFGNGIDNFDFNVIEDVEGLEDFKIQVDGLILDSDIPSNLRTKYYILCCSQKMFLHDGLTKGLSSKLAVAIISEIIIISDCIRSANLSTTSNQLECWERTLKAFEDLGMTVGFLRVRLQKLVGLKREYQAIIETSRAKQSQIDDHISNLETANLNVRTLVGCLEAEVEALAWKSKKLVFEFQALARAPW